MVDLMSNGILGHLTTQDVMEVPAIRLPAHEPPTTHKETAAGVLIKDVLKEGERKGVGVRMQRDNIWPATRFWK